eukprot:SAG31_NODE_11_length_38734_cov_21.263854_30_plen_128_part_00
MRLRACMQQQGSRAAVSNSAAGSKRSAESAADLQQCGVSDCPVFACGSAQADAGRARAAAELHVRTCRFSKMVPSLCLSRYAWASSFGSTTAAIGVGIGGGGGQRCGGRPCSCTGSQTTENSISNPT